MLSIILPARNELYLQNTINDLLDKAKGEIEIIVALDGYWPSTPIIDNDKVHLIHFSEPRGMRYCIVTGISLSKGEYIMKLDAHCAIQKGFDEKLIRDLKHDMQLLVPVRYELDITTWDKTKKCCEFEYIEKGTLKGRKWYGYKTKEKLSPIMTFQGSCWFMKRDFYDHIGGIDYDNYGSMGREAQEICLKTWTNGGECILDKNVWYAHWSKPSKHVIPEMKLEKEKSKQFALEYWTENKIKPVIEKFAPVPTWAIEDISIDEAINKMVKEKSTIIHTKNKNPKIIKGMGRIGLYKYFNARKYKIGAEIGVFRGVNAVNIFKENPKLKLYLIDPWKDYPLARKQRGNDKMQNAYEKTVKAVQNYNAVILRMYSEEAIKNIPDNSLDFVYIDGNHTFDFTLLDILLWVRKVRAGGIVSGHDYYSDKKHNIGCKEAVDSYTNYHGINFCITDKMADPNGKNSRPSWYWEVV